MELQQRLAVLKKIDLFQSLTDEEIGLLCKKISRVHLEEETILFHEGDISRDMYILLAGSLQIFKKNRRLTTIRPPDYIGEMAIIEDKPRSATVIAAAGSDLFKITLQQFSAIAKRPDALVSIIKTLSQRIRRDNELIADEFTRANILIHDMRNTTTVFLMLDLLEKICSDDKQLKYLSLMQRGRRDLAKMLEEALANAKRLHFSKVVRENSLAGLLEELAACDFTVHPDLVDKKIVLELDDDVPPFPFQRTDIHRVITNLVINAAQASKANDTIRLTLTRRGRQAIVSVCDQGCGIPANIRNKIFLPLFSSKEEGSGFGLASCKQIVEEQHGGTLSFSSKAGQGSTFPFSLLINQQTGQKNAGPPRV
ncbi:MAG: HAMP domain-containing histidine kinase [Deltaproteobacteria bacterium]|nr:HAMP domain-containing histidine kinase [Deltaproteobacteria bacterium]